MREGACGRGVDFEHEHRCPHPQPDEASLRLSARVRLPAERSGSRLSVVHPGSVPYPRRARGQGTTSCRGEELQGVVGRSIRAKVRSVFCRCSSRIARQGRSHCCSVREARVVLGEERRSPSRRPCTPERAAAPAAPADPTARARSTGAGRTREHVAEASARATERRRPGGASSGSGVCD